MDINSPFYTRKFKNSLKSHGIWSPPPNGRMRFERKGGEFVADRYDWIMPNRRFKYLHFKNGGTIRELQALPKPAMYFKQSTNYMWLDGHRYRLMRDGKYVKDDVVNWRKRPRPPVRTVLTPLGPVKTTKPGSVLSDLESNKFPKGGTFRLVNNHVVTSYLGGKATSMPLKHHTKYFYFLRKRGVFTFSEHHPYGDEHRIIRKIALGEISPEWGEDS